MEYRDKIHYFIDKLSLSRDDYRDVFQAVKANHGYDVRDARVAVFTKCANTVNNAIC